jgi:tRNA-Thr(GGU) m(6)t(6)A37 methyltransferase TsaA
MTIEMIPIGFVHCTRSEIVDDRWDLEDSHITLSEEIDPIALSGLISFSHCIIVGYLDRATEGVAARHPRGDVNQPLVGIFAQRAKDRPNRLGITVVRIVRIEDRVLYVQGLDFVDGTPVLDIKPWLQEFGPRGEVSQPPWTKSIMRNYWSDFDGEQSQ